MKKLVSVLAVSTLLLANISFVSAAPISPDRLSTSTTEKVNVFNNILTGKKVIPIILSNSDDKITKDIMTEKFKQAGLQNLTFSKTQGDLVCTGTEITVQGESEPYIVLIYGDVNGTGTVNSLDALAILQHSNNSKRLEGIYEIAGNVLNLNNNDVNSLDALRLLQFSNKSLTGSIVVVPPEFVEGFEIANSEIVDYKTIKLTLSETITGTPVITVDGEKLQTSDIKVEGNTITITKSTGFAAGLRYIEVNGTNGLTQPISTTVNKEISVIKTLNITTTGLGTAKASALPITNKVYFTAVDQYGEDLTSKLATYGSGLTMEAKKGNFPLQVSSLNTAEGSFTITETDPLLKGDVVNVTIKNTITQNAEDVVVASTSKSFTVVETDGKATTIKEITGMTDTNNVSGTTNVVLTAVVLDEFGNPATLVTGENLRWTTSDNTIVAFASGVITDTTGKVADGSAAPAGDQLEMAVDMKANGTATIRAFLPDGTEVVKPLVITVNSGTVKTINVPNVTVENNKAYTDANLEVNKALNSLEFLNGTVPPAKIGILANDVIFTVKDSKGADASGEVQFTKVTDTNGNLTGVKVTTNRSEQKTEKVAGNPDKVYTATVKVGEVESPAFTITSTIDDKIASMVVGAIPANGLTENNSVVIPVTFKNKYGEIIEITGDLATAGITKVITGNLTIETASDDKGASAVGKAVTHFVIAPNDEVAGDYTITVVKDAASVQIPVKIAKAGVLSQLTLGASSVNVIKADTLDEETQSDTDSTVMISGNTYKLIAITAKDNYGNKMTLKSSDIATVDGANDVEYLYLAADVDGKILNDALPVTTGITHIAIREDGLSTDKGANSLVFTAKDGTGKVLATANLLVNIREVRALTTLAVTPTKGTAVVGVPMEFELSGLDQYGRISPLTTPANVQMIADASNRYAIGDQAAKGANNVTFKITATEKGQYSAVVYYGVAPYDSATMKSITIPLTVGEIGIMIDSVKINNIVTVNSVEYDTSKYQVKTDTSNNIKLFSTAYDASGNKISVDASAFSYSVKSTTLTTGSTMTASIVNNNELKVENVTDGDKVVVEVSAGADKKATMTITLGKSDSIAQEGTYYLSDYATGVDANTKVSKLEKVKIDGKANLTTTVHLVAMDQYGKLMNIVENVGEVSVVLDVSTVVLPVSPTAAGFEVTAPSTATVGQNTTMRVKVGSTTVVSIPVEITTMP